MRPSRLFILSPASTAGRRARLLFSPRATFDLALRLRNPDGESIGDVFAFLSALYFRGKLAYARAFARPESAIRVITSDRGLVSPDLRVTVEDLKKMSRGSIEPGLRAYRTPLARDAERLAAEHPDGEVVLLGSIATGKYTEILQGGFGPRLVFPETFVGRGDMSRGGLMLRAARANEELTYIPVEGAVRRGKRPERLAPLRLARSA